MFTEVRKSTLVIRFPSPVTTGIFKLDSLKPKVLAFKNGASLPQLKHTHTCLKIKRLGLCPAAPHPAYVTWTHPVGRLAQIPLSVKPFSHAGSRMKRRCSAIFSQCFHMQRTPCKFSRGDARQYFIRFDLNKQFCSAKATLPI